MTRAIIAERLGIKPFFHHDRYWQVDADTLIKLIHEIEQLHKHGVMQAEGSEAVKEAAVGQRSVGTVTEGMEVTDIKTGQILNVEGYGFMFGRVNTGEIQCFNIGNVSELSCGE